MALRDGRVNTLITCDGQIGRLAGHGLCVELAHVGPAVAGVHVTDDQLPRFADVRNVVLVRRMGLRGGANGRIGRVTNADSRIAGNDHVVDGQNRLRIDTNPRHLPQQTKLGH